jgi:predicted component of type VI protein secretion system
MWSGDSLIHYPIHKISLKELFDKLPKEHFKGPIKKIQQESNKDQTCSSIRENLSELLINSETRVKACIMLFFHEQYLTN